MVTPESKAGGSVWGLRARLLVPIFGLAVVTTIVLALTGDLSARRQAQGLVIQRGNTVLEGVTDQVEERRRAKEVFAQLLAGDDRLTSAVEAGDNVGAAQVLVPLKAELSLGFIDVYDREGQELAQLGESEELMATSLIDSALSGLTQSSAVVGDEGLQVSASTPIKGSQGIMGVVIVGVVLDGESLGELKGRDDVELAAYRDGSLTATSVEQPDLVSLLGEYKSEPEGAEKLTRELDSFEFHPTIKSLGDGGELLALVPERDLKQAARWRSLTLLASSLLLLGVLLAVVMILTRSITRPLSSIVVATTDIVRGNYDRRAEPGKIRELNELGGAVNRLARAPR